MSQDVLSGQQFAKPITEDEARGNSRPVSHAEFQNLARRGHERLQALSSDPNGSARGLQEHWEKIVPHAYQEAKKSWGGVTVNAATGEAVTPTHGYALTARHPGQPEISLPENVSHEDFSVAMDRAKSSYPQLAQPQHHLGVFHDDDKHSIDIDPVLVVKHPEEVEEIGAYTHATGGAYEFHTGNGYFPPHVKGR